VVINLDEKLKAELRASVSEVIKDVETFEDAGTAVELSKAVLKLAGLVDELIKNA
jgi:hypothetical protein